MRRRSIVVRTTASTIRRLGLLQLDIASRPTAVVALVQASLVPTILRRGVVVRAALLVRGVVRLLLALLVRGRVVVVGGPAGAVEGPLAVAAAAARREAGEHDEDEQYAEDDQAEHEPAHPVVPGAVTVDSVAGVSIYAAAARY